MNPLSLSRPASASYNLNVKSPITPAIKFNESCRRAVGEPLAVRSRQWPRDGHGAERQRGAGLREPPPRKTHPGSFPSVEECACSCFFEQFRETFFCFQSLTEGCRKAYTRACGGGCPQFGSTLAKASACADSMYSAGCCVLHLLHGALAQGLVPKMFR